MLRNTTYQEGYNVVHAGGGSVEEVIEGVVAQVRELEKDYDITYISNITFKGDDGTLKNMYHATQTVTLARKPQPAKTPKGK